MMEKRKFYIEWTKTEMRGGKHDLNAPITLHVEKFTATYPDAVKRWQAVPIEGFFRIHFGFADRDAGNTLYPYLGVKSSSKGIID